MSGDSAWHSTVAAQIEDAKQRFQLEREAGQNPRIEDFLSGVRSAVRPLLLRELLRLELKGHREELDLVVMDDYQSRFPDHTEIVSNLFVELGIATSIGDFVKRLTGSGLLSNRELNELSDRCSLEQQSCQLRDLTTSLLDCRKLTEFQMGAICFGAANRLTLGEYVLLDRLGAGGMGEVYKARHRRMKRVVALKTITSKQMDTASAVRRFQREVEAAAKLEHPNIVTAYDAGEADGIHYLVMQYVDGRNLSAVVRDSGPLAISQATDYVAQAARGLYYAHTHGVVHRDIKPSNLLVDRAGQVRILDLGLARIDPAWSGQDEVTNTELTDKGQVLGTVDYMAPEQWNNSHAVDHRADIYSLGCTLYFLLSGRPPYRHHESFTEKITAHLLEPCPEISTQRADLPAGLVEVLNQCVAKRPEDRYASANELADALAPFAGREPGSVSPSTHDDAEYRRDESTFGAQRRRKHPVAARADGSPASGTATGARLGALVLIAMLLSIVVVGVVLVPRWIRPTPPKPGDLNGAHEGPIGKVRALEGHTDRVNGIAFSLKGSIAASGGEDGKAWLWNWETGESIAQLQRHPRGVTAVAFSPDGTRLVTGCADGKLRLWDGQTGEALATLSKENPAGFLCAVFLPDNRRVLTGAWDSTVRLWDMETRRQIRQFAGVSDVVYSIAVDARGERAIVGTKDARVILWDIASGTPKQELKGHSNLVMSVALSPDGERALSASWDDTVRIWDLGSGESILTVAAVKAKAVAFIADGRGMVYGDRAKRICVWNIPAERQVQEFTDQGPVDCLAVSPDSSYLLSGNDQGAITLWRLPQMPPVEHR